FCLGSDNGLMDRPLDAKIKRNDRRRLLTGEKINKYFPLDRTVLSKLGTLILPPAVMDLLSFKAAAVKGIEAVLADTHDNKNSRQFVVYESFETARSSRQKREYYQDSMTKRLSLSRPERYLRQSLQVTNPSTEFSAVQ
ncbi:hypothetical protein DOTSEDRAFT_41952, partial [Dothistroma septosporum NZE10]